MGKTLLTGFVVAVAAGLVTWEVTRAGEEKPKYTIKDVMQKAHKGGLMKKVADGKASKEEKEELLAMYTALTMNKPPMGGEKSWKEKTTALVDAAKAAAKDDQAVAGVSKAANCMGCHSVHRPK